MGDSMYTGSRLGAGLPCKKADLTSAAAIFHLFFLSGSYPAAAVASSTKKLSRLPTGLLRSRVFKSGSPQPISTARHLASKGPTPVFLSRYAALLFKTRRRSLGSALMRVASAGVTGLMGS